MEKITETLEKFIEKKDIAGAAVCVYKDHEVVYQKNFGYANIEKKETVKKNTIFRLASMSKPVTAIAIMKLVEEGRLTLEDKISKYIPEFKDRVVAKDPIDMLKYYQADPNSPLGRKALDEEIEHMEYIPAKREVTIYDCLSHSSGVGMGPVSNNWFEERITADMPLKERVKLYAQAPGDFQPGEGTGYSPMAAFDVLGRVIEIVSGMDYDTFLKEKIFQPLGIKDMGFVLNEEQKKRRSSMYEAKDGMLYEVTEEAPVLQLVNPNLYGYYSGSAGMYGTLEEYTKIARMLLNKGEYQGVQFLKKETVEMMAGEGVPHDKIFSPGSYWGLGMAIFEDPTIEGRGLEPNSFGWSGAYGTHFYVDWKNNMTVVLMVSCSNIGGANSHVSLALEKAVFDSYIKNSSEEVL